MSSDFGQKLLGGLKELEKRMMFLITDKYFIIAKYPRLPGIHLYAVLGGYNYVFNGKDKDFGIEYVSNIVKKIRNKIVHTIPLEQIQSIEITKPKKGFFSSKKGFFTIRLTNGQSITVRGEYSCPFDKAIELFNDLFPGKVKVFTQ